MSEKFQSLSDIFAAEEAAAKAKFQEDFPKIKAEAEARAKQKSQKPVYMWADGQVSGPHQNEDVAIAFAESMGFPLEGVLIEESLPALQLAVKALDGDEDEEDESEE